MKKNYNLAKLLLLAELAIASVVTGHFVIHKNVKAEEECEHVGYHYAALDETYNTAGHKEFWSCCKCHEAFLEEPEGVFIDNDDENMTGELDENHIAYIPCDPLLEYYDRYTHTTPACENIVQYTDFGGKVMTKINYDETILYYDFLDVKQGKIRSAYVVLDNTNKTFLKDSLLSICVYTPSTPEWVKYVHELDGQIGELVEKNNYSFFLVSIINPDGCEYHSISEGVSLSIELGTLIGTDSLSTISTLDEESKVQLITRKSPISGNYVKITTHVLPLTLLF